MKKMSALILVVLALAMQSSAASPVWKVSKGDKHVYIGGTIHLLSKSDYPLPAAFDKAYAESVKVVFEVDIAEAMSPVFAQKLLTQNMYMGDDDITRHLKPATVKRLDDFLKGRNLTLEPLKKMKPGFMTIMLASMELKRMGMSESGVDQFYNDKVVKDKKQLGALETVDDQLKFISSLGEGMEDEVIIHTIEEIDKIEDLMAQTKIAWRKGDMQALAKVALDDWKDEFPEVYKEILVDRNNKWMPQIRQLFETKETEFVLVGALHLAGEDGLLVQLKKAGYKIRQME